MASCTPHNLILYGPPGTGKTWRTVEKALELIEPGSAAKSRAEQVERYRALVKEGRIELVTFHQSYGYEEFVEGIRPVLDDGGSKEVRYTLQEGVFKGIALRAAAAGLLEASSEPGFDDLWGQLVEAVGKEEDFLVQGKGGKYYVLRVSPNGNLYTLQCEKAADGSVTSISDKLQRASKDNARIIWDHQKEFGGKLEGYTHEKGVQIFSKEMSSQGTVHKGGHHYTALWIVYREMLELSQRLAGTKRRLMPSPERAQAVLDGKSAESFRFIGETPQFVLIIDEINRGNISKILGELITLLEADKRLTGKDETILRLSNSQGHRFAVPPNLHVVGTMNTADRSIALMDVALRRRFDFIELMPDAEVIATELRAQTASEPHIQLVVDLFTTLNRRIAWLYDRDHQLGHAYFLQATTIEALRQVFVDRVIPLLQEYFYGAWEKIAMVLGCPYDDHGRPSRKKTPAVTEGKLRAYRAPLIRIEHAQVAAELGLEEDADDERLHFALNEGFRQCRDATDLVPYFLGVLALDEAAWKSRESALGPGVAPAVSGAAASIAGSANLSEAAGAAASAAAVASAGTAAGIASGTASAATASGAMA